MPTCGLDDFLWDDSFRVQDLYDTGLRDHVMAINKTLIASESIIWNYGTLSKLYANFYIPFGRIIFRIAS